MLSRLFNKSDYTQLGDKSVKIPKLTPEKFQQLFEAIETLPQIIVRVLSGRHSDDFVATAIIGANMAKDEAVRIVAALSELDSEYINKKASFLQISEFLRLTLEKNDLQRALKNFRAVLGLFRMTGDGGNSED